MLLFVIQLKGAILKYWKPGNLMSPVILEKLMPTIGDKQHSNDAEKIISKKRYPDFFERSTSTSEILVIF